MDTLNTHQETNTESRFGHSLFYLITVTLAFLYLVLQPGNIPPDQLTIMGNAYNSDNVDYIFSLLLMLFAALTPFPAELIAFANTFLYSPLEAFFITWLSAIISAQIGYELGRLHRINPCKYNETNKICQWLNKYGYKALAIMRLVPVVPFFALNICGGIFKLNRQKYTVITAITMVPAVALLTFFPHLFL